jgi:hypothetical protein
MTNSRLTDPEVLEMRFPVLLEDFHIRRGRDETPVSNLPLEGRSSAAGRRRPGGGNREATTSAGSNTGFAATPTRSGMRRTPLPTSPQGGGYDQSAPDSEGSGGRGKWSAGDGTLRTIRFLERMDCAILSSHREVPPHGLFGGEPGELGATWVRRSDGTLEQLQGCDQTVLEPGEAVIVRTPTGGGYGA